VRVVPTFTNLNILDALVQSWNWTIYPGVDGGVEVGVGVCVAVSDGVGVCVGVSVDV
jgi:hypothetical protein